MPYISQHLLRIAAQGSTSAPHFLQHQCRWHRSDSHDVDGEVNLCTICLEPLHAIESFSFSSPHKTRTKCFRGHLTINTVCSHIFHTQCLHDYIKHGNTCPICRCHWFDSAVEENRAWEIQGVLQALDMFDYSYASSAQKKIKLTVHAVVFEEMPAVVAYWLSTMPRRTSSERHDLAGRVARSGDGLSLVAAIVAAFRQVDGRRMRAGKAEKEIVARAIEATPGRHRKGAMREDRTVFLGVIVGIVLGYYAHSQGLMDEPPSRARRILSWIRSI
ncbi:hypothetical protein DOTSEDRAFT_39646 [Dothistroma septosporum NZE10]|uniref:RING-type domain-containing protein n=1 Tax=Dothistroma septosporum (strain NZE10 / CBS 128990) TaxID=675120 RepID=M2XGB1_DOTSN|nr:hypothetical protein DOTSEDRAFT_39646 [Dothistroma septosporum NZE10]